MTVPKIVISIAPESLQTVLDEDFQHEAQLMVRLHRAAPEMFEMLELLHEQFQPHAVGWQVNLCKLTENLLNRVKGQP